MPGASHHRLAVLSGWPLCPTSLLPIFPLLALFCRSPWWWGPSSMDLTPRTPNTPSPGCTLSPLRGPALRSQISPFFWRPRPMHRSRYSYVLLHTHTILFAAKFTGESSLQRPPLKGARSPIEVIPQLFPQIWQKLPQTWGEAEVSLGSSRRQNRRGCSQCKVGRRSRLGRFTHLVFPFPCGGTRIAP